LFLAAHRLLASGPGGGAFGLSAAWAG